MYTNSRTNSSTKARANYSREFKHRLVDAANQYRVSVSKLAQAHGVNANLLFKLRRDAKAPALHPIELVLPRSSTEILLPPPPQPETLTPEAASEPIPSGTIEIRLGRAMVIINGTVDTNALRMILEALRVCSILLLAPGSGSLPGYFPHF